MGTGHRLMIVTAVTASVVGSACRHAEPTRPVMPVRMRCIVAIWNLYGNYEHHKQQWVVYAMVLLTV